MPPYILPRAITTTSAFQVVFGGLAAISGILTFAFALWKFQGKFRAHYNRRHRQRQRTFELEA